MGMNPKVVAAITCAITAFVETAPSRPGRRDSWWVVRKPARQWVLAGRLSLMEGARHCRLRQTR